jgi:hypothetical protein
MKIIKYKDQGKGYYCIKNDDGTLGQSFDKKSGFYAEMMRKTGPDNPIEPQFTEAEKEQKVIDDSKNALASQKALCIQNLKDTDYVFLPDFEFSETDKQKIVAERLNWKRIKNSSEIEAVQKKPFS